MQSSKKNVFLLIAYTGILAILPVFTFLLVGTMISAGIKDHSADFGIGWIVLYVYFFTYLLEWAVLIWKKRFSLFFASILTFVATPIVWFGYLIYFA